MPAVEDSWPSGSPHLVCESILAKPCHTQLPYGWSLCANITCHENTGTQFCHLPILQIGWHNTRRVQKETRVILARSVHWPKSHIYAYSLNQLSPVWGFEISALQILFSSVAHIIITCSIIQDQEMGFLSFYVAVCMSFGPLCQAAIWMFHVAAISL